MEIGKIRSKNLIFLMYEFLEKDQAMQHCWKTSKNSKKLLITCFRLFRMYLKHISRISLNNHDSIFDQKWMLDLIFRSQGNCLFVLTEAHIDSIETIMKLNFIFRIIGPSI